MYTIADQHKLFTHAEYKKSRFAKDKNSYYTYNDWVMANLAERKAAELRNIPIDPKDEYKVFLVQLDRDRKPTEIEAKVLEHLKQAWNNWITLEHLHPDAVPEFRHALHMCQYLVGMRQLARVDRETWVQR